MTDNAITRLLIKIFPGSVNWSVRFGLGRNKKRFL